ncbi:MAG TPA: HAMP domain-containing sensor histidine kinase [Bacteroidales bacterium]|nr:HAMP domain-containing sensor histidine kinase [Bacteroidales bacterium]
MNNFTSFYMAKQIPLNLYNRKKRWKIVLALVALLIIGGSVYYTNNLVNQFANQERQQVRMWADAVERRASLMRYTEQFFSELRLQEKSRVELLAKAYRRLLDGSMSEDLNFYLEMISQNTSIPVVVADAEGNILLSKNLEGEYATYQRIEGRLAEAFSVYEAIPIRIPPDRIDYLYYKESLIFSELKRVLDDLVSSFLTDVASNSSSVPVIITDSTGLNILQHGNIEVPLLADSAFWAAQISAMRAENNPIEITFLDHGKTYIFYRSSPLLLKMQYFPLLQILIIALFLLIAYLMFSYARKAEQNQVWAGMAKETAHQIGTPLSSLMAWIELLRMQHDDFEGTAEMEKDIHRLEIITERFSKIGSDAVLQPTDLLPTIEETINYLKVRTSKKISYKFIAPPHPINLPLNETLFQWVIENLCKNAVDAIDGQGVISIEVTDEPSRVLIDVSDTGKGIPKSAFNSIFQPGYTSKKRGWGLGLSLARRIINGYHKGKIFVKSSVINEGTTFRIVLRK